ncbi:MAG TPA: hypothetical protein DCY07_02875 [Rhodospirillaceae bacterium]|nr:hypothetical protein [Rhodospirillaceae bacterium]
MRLLTWFLSLPVFIAVIVFVLQNRMQVPISFWPFDLEATLPVSILSLGLLIIGFILGSLVTGVTSLRANFEARRLRGEVAKLNDKLNQQQAQSQSPLSCEPTILYKGRYQTVSTLEPPAPASRWKRWFGRS